MTDKTILELPVSVTPSLSDALPIVNEGETRQITIEQINNLGYQGTDIKELTGAWQSVFTSVANTSGNWNSVFTNVASNSANYILHGGNSKGQTLTIGTNDNFSLNLRTVGSTKMSISNNGNVGIGTTSPTSPLTIQGGSAPDNTPELRINGSSGYVAIHNSLDDNGDYNFVTRAGDKAIIFTDGVESTGNLTIAPWSLSSDYGGLRITNQGKVGIGTESPNGKLDVKGKIISGEQNSTSAGVLLEGRHNLGATSVLATEHSTGGLSLGYGVEPRKNFVGEFVNSTSGPTIPRFAINVGGDSGIRFYADASVGPLPIGQNITLTERMRITKDGNIGIGTSTPSEKLSVNGNILATGDLQSANSVFWNSTYNTVNTLSGYWNSPPFMVVCSSESMNLVADSSNPLFTFRMPYDVKLREIRATLKQQPMGGPLQITIFREGSPVLSVPIQIDNGHTSSIGSSSSYVLHPLFTGNPVFGVLEDNAEIQIYVTQVGTTTPGAGLKITFK